MTDHGKGDRSNQAAALAALAVAAKRPPGQCPSDDEIAAWHERRLPGEAMKQIRSHVAGCDRCYSAWVGLVELSEPETTDVATVPSRSRWPVLVSLGVATAVVAALVVSLGPDQPGIGSGPIPSYQLTLRGTADLRSEQPGALEETLQLTTGNLFDLRLRPETAVDGPVALRMWIESQGTVTPLITPQPTVMDSGVMIVEGRIGSQIAFPSGSSNLLIAVGRQSDIPDPKELQRLLATTSSVAMERWKAWKIRVYLDDPAR